MNWIYFRCGKTTICEILSEINKQKLFTINCHTTTESADFIGSIRPVRRHEQNGKSDENPGLFEWQDGAIVCSMKDGGLFLIDEISLADDSVLERLNSVLEPEKELVLAEKGYNNDDQHIDIIKAHHKFRLIATMNPGGDFGKKEVWWTWIFFILIQKSLLFSFHQHYAIVLQKFGVHQVNHLMIYIQ